MKVLLIEPDRVLAKCISEELKKRDLLTTIVTSADRAVETADNISPDAVISELSLPGHSGTEFIYEFRTYKDWQNIPLIIYSSIKPSKKVLKSKDWTLLQIDKILYKPEVSLSQLSEAVADLIVK